MIRVSVRTGLIWIRTKTTDGLLRQKDGWSDGERMTNRFQIQDVGQLLPDEGVRGRRNGGCRASGLGG